MVKIGGVKISAGGLAGLVAAPFTGGASLLLTGQEFMKGQAQSDAKKEMQKGIAAQQAAAQQAALQEEKDVEERRKAKAASLASKGQRVSGLSSLIGSGSDTLG